MNYSSVLLAAREAGLGGGLWVVGILVGGIILLVLAMIIWNFGMLWLQAWTSDAHVGILELIGMRFRRVPPRLIVENRIAAKKAGRDVPTRFLEAHYLAGGNVSVLVRAIIAAHQGGLKLLENDLAAHVLAGGNVERVVNALIAATRANIQLAFDSARAIDLAGRDVLDAIKTSVNPRVIDCPDPRRGADNLDAVAKDGIRLTVKARVTVRTNLERLVGGATEETIIARVGEGIVSAIGSTDRYEQVLENPDFISKKVLNKGLDSETAFNIVSIDIADVSVPETYANVGAKLRIETAEAQKQIYQAEAEQRRALALAREQEMRAQVEENRAKVVEAEAQVPLAIAEAFRSGRLGIMDYYQIRNIQADTHMRDSIAGGTSTKDGKM